MVSKIAGGSTQRLASTQVAKETAKPKATAQSSTTQQAWKAGAGKKPQVDTSALKVSKAQIGDGPATTDKLTLPRGFSQVDGAIKHHESLPLADGRTANLDVDWATLSVKGPGGKSVELSPMKPGDLKEQQEWFREEFKGKSKADLEFASFPEWSAERSFRGAGNAGKMVSVMESAGSYTGGAHPNHGSALTTFDLTTGKQVKLDELLPKATVDKLAASIHARLQTLGGPDGIEGTTFTGGGDVKSIRDTINDNFALTTDKKGKVNIEIAWESGIHALGGVMAHFTVPAPTDDAFKSKIGAE